MMENAPFSKLSAELRNRIWMLAVTSNRKTLMLGEENAKQPGITRTCKQIRDETLLMFFHNNDIAVNITFPSPYNQHPYATQKIDTKLHAVTEWLARQQTPVHACIKGLTFTITYTVPSGRFPHDSTRYAWNLLVSQLDTCGYSGSRLPASIRLLGVTGTDYVDQSVLGLQLGALRRNLQASGFDVPENAEVESYRSGRFRVMECDMGTES